MIRQLVGSVILVAGLAAPAIALAQPKDVGSQPLTAPAEPVTPTGPALPAEPTTPKAPGDPALGTPEAPKSETPTPEAATPAPPSADEAPIDPGSTVDVDPSAATPDIRYDEAALPQAVRDVRRKIIEATKTGDVESLRPIIEANEEPPAFPGDDGGDPIAALKLLSGDEQGREILAILQEVLEAGYVHVDAGTPQEMYIWPYFTRVPLANLTGPQLVELFRLVTAGDFADMQDKGVYSFYRAGIAPDGTWRFFEDGD